MDLQHLQASLRQFAAERDWQRFHTPKNLSTALMVEAAELAEIFQWMTPEESAQAHRDAVEHERISDEVADVLLYLLQLADHCSVDLKRAVGRKLQKNARKHPPTRPGLPAGPAADEQVPVHALVDWENVQPRGADIQALVPGVTHVWIFHGRQQRRVDAHQQVFGEHLTLVPVSRPGKNALDFHLSFYMGYIMSRNPRARLVVISNDQGYGPMLDHARDLGFDAAQLGFVKSAARKRSTRAAPAAKAPEAAAVPAPQDTGRGAKAATKVARKAATKNADKAASKAATKAATTAPSKAASKAAAKATPKPRVKPTAPPPEPTAAATLAAPVPEAATAAPRKGRTGRRSSASALPPAPAPAPVSPAAQVSARDYAHVLKSLARTRDRPAKLAPLRRMLRSWLPSGQADDEAVQAVLQRLVDEGHVQLGNAGAVSVRVPAKA